MKSLKLLMINALTLFIGLGLLSGSFTGKSANAARFETIPSLQINRLGNLRGHYLTAIYAVGSRPIISTDPSQINISQIKESRTVYLTSDTVSLPAVKVEKEGFRPSYNIIIFVVSPTANYSWINADGTVPQGMNATENHLSSVMSSINKSDVDKFISTHGADEILAVNLN